MEILTIVLIYKIINKMWNKTNFWLKTMLFLSSFDKNDYLFNFVTP